MPDTKPTPDLFPNSEANMPLWMLLTLTLFFVALLAWVGYCLTPADAEKMRQKAKQRMPWL